MHQEKTAEERSKRILKKGPGRLQSTQGGGGGRGVVLRRWQPLVTLGEAAVPEQPQGPLSFLDGCSPQASLLHVSAATLPTWVMECYEACWKPSISA